MPDNDMDSRVRLRELTVLSDNHYVLRKARFELLRRDGRRQELLRESYDIGDGAAVLPVDAARGLVLLIRQFRWPAFEAGHPAPLIEAVAGKLDGDDPEQCVRKEAMEEAGVRIGALERVTKCFTSPGAVKEQLSLFLAAYDSAAPRAKGGGDEAEGEDIEVLEMSLDAALDLVAHGEINDAKTILLLQAAKLKERK